MINIVNVSIQICHIIANTKLPSYDKLSNSGFVMRNDKLKNGQWPRNPARGCFADGCFVRHCSVFNFDGGSSGQMPNMMPDAKKLCRDEISSSLVGYAELAGGRGPRFTRPVTRRKVSIG